MTAKSVPLIPEVFDLDDDDPDFDEAGTFGLHLGVLRRFARLGRQPEQPATNQPASGQ